jgi:hypothetical protein
MKGNGMTNTQKKNTSLMAIGGKPLESFAMLNNLLAPNTKATDLRISPQATMQQLGIIMKTLRMGPLV